MVLIITIIFRTAFSSYNFYSLTPRKWLILSTLASLFGYSLFYLVSQIPLQFIPVVQIFGGSIAGFGNGFAWTIAQFTPQGSNLNFKVNYRNAGCWCFLFKPASINLRFLISFFNSAIAWLNQTRSKMNPYLMLGGAIGMGLAGPFG